jgi:hypothetical protein
VGKLIRYLFANLWQPALNPKRDFKQLFALTYCDKRALEILM